jgi:hypothetical protein
MGAYEKWKLERGKEAICTNHIYKGKVLGLEYTKSINNMQ